MTSFQMPAEWARHDAVWTAWPYLEDQWSEGLDNPRRALMAMCRAIVDVDGNGVQRGERVEIFVRDSSDESHARELLGASAAAVRFHKTSYGDIWLRDTGPLFVVSSGGDISAAHFRFDGWGGKYVMDGDTEVAGYVLDQTKILGCRFDFVLEGGAVEVDGAGLVMTTKQCLLGGKRNPTLTQSELDARLAWALGASDVIWLDSGLINDHTDGHIDTIARFVAPGVVACMEPAADDPNRDAMLQIIADLRGATTARGKLEVVVVPSPGAIVDRSGTLMPASYMNFYIANTTVVVPVYGAQADDAACAKIAAMFPSRRVVPCDGKSVVVGGGAFHCATQQQPARDTLLR